MPIKISSSEILLLSGPDAAAFAHAQFSSDVLALAPGHWQWSTWLTPQGRVRWFFALLRLDADTLLVWLRGGNADVIQQALQRFVFRSKVTVRVPDTLSVYGFLDPSELADVNLKRAAGDEIAKSGDVMTFALHDSRQVAIADETALSIDHPLDEHPWRLADIRAGIPKVADALSEAALPHWLGLLRLGAVNAKKGCYPGQEVMSRLHFKGGNKRNLYRVRIAGSSMRPAGTAIIIAGESEHAGQIVTAEPMSDGFSEALAILADAAAEKSLRIDASNAAAIEVLERFA